MADDLTPLPTLKEIMRTRRLNQRDAAAVLDKMTQDRAAALTQRAQQEAAARRDAIEAEKVKSEAESRRAAAEAEARRLKMEEERVARQNSPAKQAVDAAMMVAPYPAGAYLGHKAAKGLVEGLVGAEEHRARQMTDAMAGAEKLTPHSAEDIASARAKVRNVDRQGLMRGRGISQYLAPLLLGAEGTATMYAAPHLFDEGLSRQASEAFGRASQVGAGIMGAEQFYNQLQRRNPLDMKATEQYERLKAFPSAPVPPSPPSATSGASSVADDVAVAESAAGAQKAGAAAADYKAMSHRDLQAAYRVKFGSATAPRNATKEALMKALESGEEIRRGKVSPGLLSALMPVGVGMTVYDAMRSPATAAEAGNVEPAGPATAAGAGLAAGGAAYGAQKGASALGGWIGPRAARAASAIPGAAAAGRVAARAVPWAATAGAAYDLLSPSSTQSAFADTPEGRKSPIDPDVSDDDLVIMMANELVNEPVRRKALIDALLQQSTPPRPTVISPFTMARPGQS